LPHSLGQTGLTARESPHSQILIQEERAIARLAYDTHTAVAKVQEIFLAEYQRLALKAHIKAFLPVLVARRVKAILRKIGVPAAPAPEL
jgi:hypothetical protein